MGNTFEELVLYGRVWHSSVDSSDNFLLYVEAMRLYNLFDEQGLDKDIPVKDAIGQFLPMELFKDSTIDCGYNVQTLGDHATESDDWIEKIYTIEHNFGPLIKGLRESLNVMRVCIVFNVEFLSKDAANYFKIKYNSKFLVNNP